MRGRGQAGIANVLEAMGISEDTTLLILKDVLDHGIPNNKVDFATRYRLAEPFFYGVVHFIERWNTGGLGLVDALESTGVQKQLALNIAKDLFSNEVPDNKADFTSHYNLPESFFVNILSAIQDWKEA